MCMIGEAKEEVDLDYKDAVIGFRRWQTFNGEPSKAELGATAHRGVANTWVPNRAGFYQAMRRNPSYDVWNPNSKDMPREIPAQPNMFNESGFWAYTNERELKLDKAEISGIFGVIAGFGKCVIHQIGFRCERAEILQLVYCVSRSDDLNEWEPYHIPFMKGLARRYRVPVILYDTREPVTPHALEICAGVR